MASRCRRGRSELRVVLLELERLYNHVADVGALCNDVGFGLVQAKALTLRERLLRLNRSVTGHRLLRGGVRPSGACVVALPGPTELAEIGAQFHELVDLARGQGTVMDRFTGTAVLHRVDVDALGVLGVVARASGSDVRRPPGPSRGRPADRLHGGERFRRRRPGPLPGAGRRIRLLPARCSPTTAPDPDHCSAFGENASVSTHGTGSGIVEGWRGTIVHRVEVDGAGRLTPGQGRRPFVLQLAGPLRGARRHHRPGLPSGQQELQPLLCRQRPVRRPAMKVDDLFIPLGSRPTIRRRNESRPGRSDPRIETTR